MELGRMKQTIKGIRYDTEKATLLADNEYWDGNNHERGGRNAWLFRGKNGHYFMAVRTMWIGEEDRLVPLTEEEAMQEYDNLREKDVDFEQAFPNRVVEEA